MKLISTKDILGDNPPADYTAKPSEDIHIDAILADILVKDDFSFGETFFNSVVIRT